GVCFVSLMGAFCARASVGGVGIPAEPVVTGPLFTNGQGYDVVMHDDLGFISDAEGGLLIVRFGLAADLDLDSRVGLADLTRLLSHFGTAQGVTRADGDVTGDGRIDLADLLALLGAFGATCE